MLMMDVDKGLFSSLMLSMGTIENVLIMSDHCMFSIFPFSCVHGREQYLSTCYSEK